MFESPPGTEDKISLIPPPTKRGQLTGGTVVSSALRVAIGTAHLTISNVFVRLLSVIALPVLTALLPPSAYGTAAMVTTLISLVSVLALAGADVSYIRASHAEGSAAASSVEAFTWQYAIGAASAAALVSALFWAPVSHVLLLPGYAGWLVAMGIVLSVSMTMAMARARLRDRYAIMSVATVCGGLAATSIAIGLAYLGHHDEFPLLVSMLAGYGVPVLILGVPSLSALLKPSGLKPGKGREILGIGFAVIVTAPAYWVISSSDRWVLGYFEGAAPVGVYSVGSSVGIVGLTVNTALIATWLPEASRLFEARSADSLRRLGSMTEAMIALLACVWLAVTAAGGDIVRLLSSPPFHPGAEVVPFLAGSVFFAGIAQLANTVYVLETQVQRTIRWWILGAVVSFVFNFLLIPWIGMLGAAISQLLSVMLVALALGVNAWQMLPAKIGGKRLALTVLTVLTAALFMIPPWSEKPLTSLILKLPLGLAVTLIVMSYFGAASIVRALTKKATAA
jgi:O-antigen/teichoic acid export membrane protein